MKYPIDLPNPRDPRLHVAAIVISIHILGQTALDFRVSVPQILSAIVTCAVIEVALSFRTTHRISWPASAMLTGSGVALIFRIVGFPADEPWAWRGWYLFALVAGLSLLTKYLIRVGEDQVFNPSNVGLVVAFLLLGSSRVEPLDFWWSPLNGWMALAYAIILIGGLLVTRRLKLLPLAVSFWLSFAVFLGLVASTGHCITATWALDAICGTQFWWVLITSPEVLIFLFFMITDPKTVPVGRWARVGFGIGIAFTSTVLMSTQITEFGSKVALLGGLVILTPVRRLFERVPDTDTEAPSPGLRGWFQTRIRKPLVLLVSGVGVCLVLGPIAVGSLLAESTDEASTTQSDVGFVFEVPEIDPAALPAMTVGDDVLSLRSDAANLDPETLAVALAENLAIEGEALRTSNLDLLSGADIGLRLVEMQRLLEAAGPNEERVVPTFEFEELHLRLIFQPGTQARPNLGIDARGHVEEISYAADHTETSRSTRAFALTFQVEKGSDDRWLIANVLPQS